jgi:N-acetyl-alpha-D-glucosaminyl L-malate synthase BshA
MNKSDGLTAVSESLKKDTFNHFQISKQIEVIPNFVDISRFKRKQNCSYRNFIAPNNEKILIHVSNFRAVKRVEDTIHILSNLVGRVSVKLLLVGDGPERQNVEMLAREMNLMHHIHFLGKQDAIEDLLSVSDLFLMPSASESFGLSALEAMACQVPVVSSDVGGLPEVNINGITGYCCKVGDITDMSEKSFQILTNDSHLELLRANSLEQANKFSIQKIIPIYEEYYKHIIDTFVY